MELVEKFKRETEEYRERVEEEVQEILSLKGITRDRMNEIEHEVREKFIKQEISQGNNSSRKDLDNEKSLENSDCFDRKRREK